MLLFQKCTQRAKVAIYTSFIRSGGKVMVHISMQGFNFFGEHPAFASLLRCTTMQMHSQAGKGTNHNRTKEGKLSMKPCVDKH